MSAVTSHSSPADPWRVAADIFDPPVDSDRETALACRASLRTFIREAWPIVEPAAPFVATWHIDVVCEHLEAVTAGELPRLIINIPPRATKSLLACVFWPSWEWLDAPHVRWLFASYAAQLAQRDSLKMRRVIRSRGGRQDGSLFQRIGYHGVLRLLGSGPWELTKDQDAKTKFENTETGMRMATSVGALATGEGGDRIVVDDPVNAEQARSDTERKTANTWWDETMTTRFNDSRSTAVIVMQRLHQADLTGHLLERGGWHHLCLPGTYEPSHPFVYPTTVVLPERTYTVQGEDGEAEELRVPGGRVLLGDPRTAEGEPLDPVRLGPAKLAELHRDLASYGFAGQIQQRPSPAEGGMFKRHWWGRWQPAGLPPLWQRVIASWDMRFSDSQAAASSYVVGQVWGVDGADRYLLGQIRARLSFTDSVKAVRTLADWDADPRTGITAIASAKLVERKANGAAVIDTLRSKITGLIPIEPEGGKEVRAAAVEPTVEAGNVFLPAGEWIPAPAGFEPTRVEDFIEEHAVFPNGAHDDQVDGMSQALNWLQHRLGVVTTESYMGSHEAPVVHRGELTFRGERYVDKV